MTVSRRRRRKKKKTLPILLGIILCLAVFTCAYGFASGWFFPFGGTGDSGENELTGGGDKPKINGFSALLLGTDDRDSNGNYSRTDTIIVMNYNDKENRLALLSIPRDTRVMIPGHGRDKINAANVYGGPELAMETVSDLLGMSIDYYVLTNFYGFKDIVDALGGVTLNVEKDMYHPGEQCYGGKFGINLKKGVQRLDGDKALQYVRYRGDGSDINRTARQLKFLKALADEVMQPSTLTKLHKLIPEIYENVETNMRLPQLMKLAKAGKNLGTVDLVTQTLPGYYLNNKQGSFWDVDKDEAHKVALALFEEGKVVKQVVKGTKGGSLTTPSKEQEVMLSQKDNSVQQPSSTGDAAEEETQPAPAGGEDSATSGTGEGNNDLQENEQVDNTESPVEEAKPPEGLPQEPPAGGRGEQGDKQVEIIIDI